MTRYAFLVLLLLLTQTTWAQTQRADILIRNGRLYDGTGNTWTLGDVAIRAGRIVAVGRLPATYPADTVLDAQGLAVAPGFIDVHTHIEDDEVRQPTADNFIYDGVTTVVTGNCGSSRPDLRRYFHMLDSTHLSVNVASLVGHGTVRKAVMGRARRVPSEVELQRMEALVDSAMRAGAVGLSSGLIYVPGTYSRTPELVRLARVAGRYHGLYATHMRNESDSVTFAIQEALKVGQEAGLPVQISHLKLGGQQNWGRTAALLRLIEDARRAGQQVTIDQYPYTASSTSLSTLLPDAVQADGRDSLRARLARPAVRKAVEISMLARLKRRKLKHFSYAVVASFPPDTSYNGRSIEEINRLRRRPHTARAEAATVLDLVLQYDAGMVFHGMSEDDVQNIMRYPQNMVASDASIRVWQEGVPHPRGYGSNARVLGRYVRELHIITLEEAIRRMTSLPAQTFGFTDRGLLRPGLAADIVVFDPTTVQDRSTFEQPHQYSVGMKYVLVNGRLTVRDGRHTGIRNGQVLYGAGRK
ncbi:N-acyl-D-amino-acid deacylase family protein [Hymenobacter psychrotolerans]|uniref:N-acyl-D-amino-acid deacylase n=1 Tax=Hymenobacter psychrotolerans DSM 18569 TaxID=1121959 RepID=A0A1M6WRY2_9BACT|nr:D-aminoacylase [Hymenobacter psychrotolerans]SHK96285.1 N-acyl-D-amino-acid deacylase [Hymenobacter psychrotolerans DSM 18569]